MDFYAEAKGLDGIKDNGIRPDQVGHEGEDMFRAGAEPYLRGLCAVLCEVCGGVCGRRGFAWGW